MRFHFSGGLIAFEGSAIGCMSTSGFLWTIERLWYWKWTLWSNIHILGLDILDSEPLSRGMHIGYFYGTLGSFVCIAKWSSDHAKAYGDNIMEVTTENSPQWENLLHERRFHFDILEHHVWIVPVPLYALQFLKNALCMHGDEASELERWSMFRRTMFCSINCDMWMVQPVPTLAEFWLAEHCVTLM